MSEHEMHTKEAVGSRILLVRQYFKLSQIKMAADVGAKYGSYQANERGINLPGGAILAGYVRIGINVNWLLTGEGPMLIEEMKNSPIAMPEKAETREDKTDNDEERTDPRVIAKIAARLMHQSVRSPSAMLRFTKFIQQFRQPLLWVMQIEEQPALKQGEPDPLQVMIDKFQDQLVDYTINEANVMAHIYNRVWNIKDNGKQNKAIVKEVDFLIQVHLREFADQFRDPSVQPPILDPNHVSTGGINF